MSRAADKVAVKTVRLAPWGQIALHERAADAPMLVETVQVAAGQAELALSTADHRSRLRHPSFVPVSAIAAVEDVGLGRAVQVELEAPRGSALIDVLERCGRLSERLIAGLLRDLLRAVGEAHGKSIVMGDIAPDHLVLCPPGQEDLPPLRLVHAGLGPVVEAARGSPLPMDASGFAQLHMVAEVVAPEIFAGQQLSASSDTYALCAVAARCALGRYVHGAAQASSVKALAQSGPQPGDIAELADMMPRLGPLVVKGLAANPWARAGVLAELQSACDELVEGWPRHTVAEREVVAPWQRGSPLVPLAAYVHAGMWCERFSAQASAGTPLRFDAVKSATQKHAAAQIAVLPSADQAKLRAALERLESEKRSTQMRSEQRETKGVARFAAVLIFALIALAIAAVLMRQTAKLEEDAVPEFHRPVGPKKPPPPRPQPIILDPEAEKSK